jgi:hypothetical protein
MPKVTHSKLRDQKLVIQNKAHDVDKAGRITLNGRDPCAATCARLSSIPGFLVEGTDMAAHQDVPLRAPWWNIPARVAELNAAKSGFEKARLALVEQETAVRKATKALEDAKEETRKRREAEEAEAAAEAAAEIEAEKARAEHDARAREEIEAYEASLRKPPNFALDAEIICVGVNSTNVKALGYLPEAGVVQAEFHDGSVYRYARVSAADGRRLMSDDKPGLFFNVIKGKCPCYKMPEPEPEPEFDLDAALSVHHNTRKRWAGELDSDYDTKYPGDKGADRADACIRDHYTNVDPAAVISLISAP